MVCAMPADPGQLSRLGIKPIVELGFTYIDGNESAVIDKPHLLQSLSTGEKKALYILNVIFDIETRKNNRQETLVVVDDVADSFDYQNKYAIIQYLKEISEDGLFKEIILTPVSYTHLTLPTIYS